MEYNSWSKKKIDTTDDLYEVLDSASQLICEFNKNSQFMHHEMTHALVLMLEAMDYLNEVKNLGGGLSIQFLNQGIEFDREND